MTRDSAVNDAERRADALAPVVYPYPTAPLPPPPAYLAAETAARLEYAALPWRERLLTPPPPGWAGAWTARLVSRVAAHARRTK